MYRSDVTDAFTSASIFGRTGTALMPFGPAIGALARDAWAQEQDEQPASAGDWSESWLSFDSFRLCPQRRLLLEGDEPVRIGSRALDILIALLERPGELFGKPELLARVWPGIAIEEGNLKFNVTALRRALRDGQEGKRYICNVIGRGYCFVAPVRRSVPQAPSALPHSARSLGSDLVPAARASRERCTAVMGSGDMTRALVLATMLTAGYQPEIRRVDIGRVDDPRALPAAIAAALALDVGADDPLAALAAWLEDKRILLLLDNCRHLAEATVDFGVAVARLAPHALVLMISQ
jgi:DNA-binding winged helix-turn-helix (wHTH) protein